MALALHEKYATLLPLNTAAIAAAAVSSAAQFFFNQKKNQHKTMDESNQNS